MRNKTIPNDEPVPVSASADVLSHSTHSTGAGSSLGGAMEPPTNARGRLPWDYDAPDWGRFDYRAWHDSYYVSRMHWVCRGLYHQLLDLQWKYGFVPNSWYETATLLGADPHCDGDVGWVFKERSESVWEVAISFFDPHPADPDRLINKRQAYERWRAIDALEKKAIAGKKGGEARARNLRQTLIDTSTAQASLKQRSSDAQQNKNKSKNKNTTSVPNGTAPDDVENWNDVLAPLCRVAGGEDQVPNWLRWCKRQLGVGVTLETLEDWIGGMVELRDSGRLAYIPKGQTFKPAAIERLPTGERDQLRKALR